MDFIPPNYVLNPNNTTQFALGHLYFLAISFLKSALLTLAVSGWVTSTTYSNIKDYFVLIYKLFP